MAQAQAPPPSVGGAVRIAVLREGDGLRADACVV